MSISPPQFFRFLGDHADLVMVLYDRGGVDEAELMSLIVRHRDSAAPAPEHIRRQLQELGVIEPAPDADASFELTRPVADVLAWLTHRQRLASAAILRAYLSDVEQAERDIAAAMRTADPSAAAVSLRELDSLIERIRSLSEGNREAVVTEVQRIRGDTDGISAVERFDVVTRLWERHLLPLQDLVRVSGEMEQLLDRMRYTLDSGEQHFAAHGPVARAFSSSLARLARMRRAALDDHMAAIKEVEPVYQRVRRDSRWITGASRALARIRAEGVGGLGLDARLGLVGWRTRYLMSDAKIRARFAALVGYTPTAPEPIAAAPAPPPVPLITREEVRQAVEANVPIDDVLGFVLARWPDLPLGAQLRAFGELAAGSFGPLGSPEPPEPRRYDAAEATIEASRLTLEDAPARAEVTP